MISVSSVAAANFAELATTVVYQRLETPTDRVDIIGKLIEGKDDEGKPMGRPELAGETIAYLNAGTGTLPMRFLPFLISYIYTFTEMTRIPVPPTVLTTTSPRIPPPNPNSRQSSTRASDTMTTQSHPGQPSKAFPASTLSSTNASGYFPPFLWVSPVSLPRAGCTFWESFSQKGRYLHYPS